MIAAERRRGRASLYRGRMRMIAGAAVLLGIVEMAQVAAAQPQQLPQLPNQSITPKPNTPAYHAPGPGIQRVEGR